jgi:hypothetical protein
MIKSIVLIVIAAAIIASPFLAVAVDDVFLPLVGSGGGQTIPAEEGLVSAAADQTISLSGGQVLAVACAGRRLTFSRISQTNGQLTCLALTPTATPFPATDTPAPPTNTPIPPTATPQPGAGSTPFASAPKCATHDSNLWHSVWDAQRACYYDHTHADDPSTADDLFGALGAQWGGALMPPWGMPNEFGPAHGGWKVEVNRDLPGRPGSCWFYDGCVVAMRSLTHFGPKGGQQPEHTFWLEAVVEQDGVRGLIRTGGTWMTGIIHSPYKSQWVNMPLDPPFQGLQFRPGADDPNQALTVDPYRAHGDCADTLRYMEEPDSKQAELITDPAQMRRGNNHFWIMHDNLPNPDGGRIYGMTPFVHLAQSMGDGSSCVEANGSIFVREPFLHEIDPARCPLLPNGAIGCRFNNSYGPILFDVDLIFGSWMGWLDGSPWDTNPTAGMISMNTFIKPVLRNADGSVIAGRPDPRRFFSEAAHCTQAGMECVPLIVENVKVGIYNWTTPHGGGFWKASNYDVLLPGVWWLGPGN